MRIKRNIGLVDALIRTSISLVMLYLGFIDETVIRDETARLMLGTIGCLSLLVAIIGNCPFYTLIGFSSCKQNDDN